MNPEAVEAGVVRVPPVGFYLHFHMTEDGVITILVRDERERMNEGSQTLIPTDEADEAHLFFDVNRYMLCSDLPILTGSSRV